MGKSNKLFKALVIGVKAFKSPSKDRREKIKSASEGDKDWVKDSSKDKCLWSLGKSSSRERSSVAAAAAYLDAPNISFSQNENEQVKDAPHTSHSITSTPACSPKNLVKAEAEFFTGGEPVDLVEREELAAVKIQAAYRGHLVSQQVLRALRAVVRLQALARGQMVRKQASATLRCMRAIVKLQALARGRHIRSSELGQLVQEHLQQTSQQRKKLVEGWINSISTLQQVQAKEQSNQDAVLKQQRALVHTFSDPLSRCTPTHHSPQANDFQPNQNHWHWVWLERWMAARPWEDLSGVVKKEHNQEKTVHTKAESVAEMNEENHEKCISPLKNPAGGNANIESTSSNDSESDCLSNSQSATEKEARTALENMQVEGVHVSPSIEKVATAEKSATETSSADNDLEIKKAASLSAPPTPPLPPPLPLYAKRTSPVAHVTISPEGQQAAILANRCFERPVAFEVPHLTSAARAAELPVETCSTTFATQLDSPRASESASPDLPSLPVKDSLPSTTANMPMEASTAQTTLQSNYEVAHLRNQSSQTTSSLTQQVNEALLESDMENLSMPVPRASNFVPISPSQTPSSPTVFFEELVLSPEKHDPACSPLYVSDDTHHYGISNQGYTSENNGGVITGERTTSAVPPILGFEETIPAESGSMDLENDPNDMDTEVLEPINFKTEVIQGDSLSEANGGGDASGEPVGEKAADFSLSKHANPASKQGQHTEAGLPSVPNYMTKTKCSQAKIRTLTSPEQRLDSAKQKGDPWKPRFDSSAKQKGNSPKQKLDSSKQKLDSPMQKADSTISRRHSLSALEGKGSLGALKSSPHVRASSRGRVSSFKDAFAENLRFPNGSSRKHGKLLAV